MLDLRSWIWTNSTWSVILSNKFLYAGWNLVGELNAASSNAPLRTYLWGLDLSGSEQGAGGVGGLLLVTDYVGGTTHHRPAYDGNGNLAALVAQADGSLSARYEYGPFGEALRATGPMAKKNPLRFSTKYTDDHKGQWGQFLVLTRPVGGGQFWPRGPQAPSRISRGDLPGDEPR